MILGWSKKVTVECHWRLTVTGREMSVRLSKTNNLLYPIRANSLASLQEKREEGKRTVGQRQLTCACMTWTGQLSQQLNADRREG